MSLLPDEIREYISSGDNFYETKKNGTTSSKRGKTYSKTYKKGKFLR